MTGRDGGKKWGKNRMTGPSYVIGIIDSQNNILSSFNPTNSHRNLNSSNLRYLITAATKKIRHIQPTLSSQTTTASTTTLHHATMSALDPKGSSQPSLSQAYTTPGNPAQKDPKEQAQTEFNASDNAATVDQRIPTKQATDAEGLRNAKFEQGKGVHGAPPGEEAKGLSHEDVGRHKELDAQQMAAPGEGRVADAVAKGGKGMGGGGEQPDLASDLDR